MTLFLSSLSGGAAPRVVHGRLGYTYMHALSVCAPELLCVRPDCVAGYVARDYVDCVQKLCIRQR